MDDLLHRQDTVSSAVMNLSKEYCSPISNIVLNAGVIRKSSKPNRRLCYIRFTHTPTFWSLDKYFVSSVQGEFSLISRIFSILL